MLGHNEGGKLADRFNDRFDDCFNDCFNDRFIDLSFLEQFSLTSRFSEIKFYLYQIYFTLCN